jgi:hypothetical protein
MKRLVVLPFLILAACGPLSVAEAERQCLERARLAKAPTGEVTIGVGSGGKTSAGIEVEVGSDFILGRDPSAVFESCVMQKSGELPSRPLMQQPGWR